MSDDKLLVAKDRLSVALGAESMKTYLSYLMKWFRKVLTREQFDFECRQLLSADQKHLHNEFLLAILKKVTQPIQEEPIKAPTAKKSKRRTRSERSIFEPVQLFDYLPEENDELPSQVQSQPMHQPRFIVEELFLPDSGLILGRLLIIAWENGLSNADTEVSEILVQGVQVLLKNILTEVIKLRKNYRTTQNDGGFFYDVGCEYKNPFTRNTSTRHIVDDHPFEVDREVASTSLLHRTNDESFFLSACESGNEKPVESRITLRDLYITLQDKTIIPCHPVYANNMERITQALH